MTSRSGTTQALRQQVSKRFRIWIRISDRLKIYADSWGIHKWGFIFVFRKWGTVYVHCWTSILTSQRWGKNLSHHCCLRSCDCCLCLSKGKDTVVHVDSHGQRVCRVCVSVCVHACLLRAFSGSLLAGSVNRNEKNPPGLGVHWI